MQFFFRLPRWRIRGSKLRQRLHLNKNKSFPFNHKKKNWSNNLQGNEIFMYFGCNLENEIKYEKNHHPNYNCFDSDFVL